MLEDRNNAMIFLLGIYSIFMQTSSTVLVLQHGRRAHTLYEITVQNKSVEKFICTLPGLL